MAVTGETIEDIEQRALESGMDAVLPKDALREQIERHVNLARQPRSPKKMRQPRASRSSDSTPRRSESASRSASTSAFDWSATPRQEQAGARKRTTKRRSDEGVLSNQ